jgi:hypothetical protein
MPNKKPQAGWSINSPIARRWAIGGGLLGTGFGFCAGIFSGMFSPGDLGKKAVYGAAAGAATSATLGLFAGTAYVAVSGPKRVAIAKEAIKKAIKFKP